jgi:hypothetical protein
MLDRNTPDQAVTDWIGSLTCDVQFPEKMRANFERTGPAPTIPDDVRSTVRIHCCGNNRAALELRQTLPAIPRENAWNSIYMTNVSKNGCGFIHSQILYPSERFSVILLTGIKRFVEVVWCRRIDTYCYSVGSRFCSQENATAGATR